MQPQSINAHQVVLAQSEYNEMLEEMADMRRHLRALSTMVKHMTARLVAVEELHSGKCRECFDYFPGPCPTKKALDAVQTESLLG